MIVAPPMIRLAIFIVLVGACAADPDPGPGQGSAAPIDPIGHYTATATWTGGNCQVTAPETDTFTVTRGANGVEVTTSDPDVTYDTFEVSCSNESCQLQILRQWFVDADHYTLESDLTLAADDTVTGNATLKRYLGSYGEDCRQTADVTGQRM